MPTILELYNKGQRQFPMRGGGVSPPIEKSPPKDKYGFKINTTWHCDDYKLTWLESGNLSQFGSHTLDLIPEPLPELETLKVKLAEIEKACEPIVAHGVSLRKDKDLNAWSEKRFPTLNASIHALTKAIKGTDDVL